MPTSAAGPTQSREVVTIVLKLLANVQNQKVIPCFLRGRILPGLARRGGQAGDQFRLMIRLRQGTALAVPKELRTLRGFNP